MNDLPNGVIRQMRRFAGLTQATLAHRLGTTQSAIARWERGAVSPSVNTIWRIAHACGLEPQIVWTRRPDVDRDQMTERLAWSPRERLQYLVDMLDFEARARQARPVSRLSR